MIEAIGAAAWSNLDVIVPVGAFAMVLLGVAITLPVSGPDAEPAARWRYHPQPHVLRARVAARHMIIATALIPVAALIVLVARPGFSGGGYEPWFVASLPWIGWTGYAVGLGWMIRIYRAQAEPDEPTWRYRP